MVKRKKNELRLKLVKQIDKIFIDTINEISQKGKLETKGKTLFETILKNKKISNNIMNDIIELENKVGLNCLIKSSFISNKLVFYGKGKKTIKYKPKSGHIINLKKFFREK